MRMLCRGAMAMGKKEILTAHFVFIEKFTEIYSNNIQMIIIVEYTHRVLRTPFLRVHNSQLTIKYTKLRFSVTFNTERK